MNINLATSFIVGGLLLIALMTLSSRISMNSGQTAMSQITKQRIQTISQIVAFDIRKVGQPGAGSSIQTATRNQFSFQTTFDNVNISTVTWQFLTDVEIPGTPNPRHRRLIRVVNSDTTNIDLGVTQFDFTYFNANGDTTLVPAQIRRIRIQVTSESDAPIGNDFSISYWETDITPRAIQ